MLRREFLSGSAVSALASLLAAAPELEGAQQHAGIKLNGPSPLQLTSVVQPQSVHGLYSGSKGPEAAASAPYVYAYFDAKNTKKFINPLDIVPTTNDGTYTLESTLHAFNIMTADQTKFKNLKNDVQLGFNATAPITNSDKLTWLFMNAINVFAAKPADQSSALTKFNNDAGTPLQATPKVTVTKGIVNLQITAFGQKKDGFWRKFFDIMASVTKSPVVSAALTGFGIPSLAGDAVQFVDHAIDVFTNEEKLVPLWQTGSLEFAVTKGADALFKMNPGYWVTIDSAYAQKTNFLEGHTIDFTFETFRVLDQSKQAADANYLVAELKLTS